MQRCSTDVPKYTQLTPDGANRRSTWSRAAVATQTAVCQPISGPITFFALRVTMEHNNNSVFKKCQALLIMSVSNSRPFTSVLNTCRFKHLLHELTRTDCDCVCLSAFIQLLFPLVGQQHAVAGQLSAVRLTSIFSSN